MAGEPPGFAGVKLMQHAPQNPLPKENKCNTLRGDVMQQTVYHSVKISLWVLLHHRGNTTARFVMCGRFTKADFKLGMKTKETHQSFPAVYNKNQICNSFFLFAILCKKDPAKNKRLRLRYFQVFQKMKKIIIIITAVLD